MPVERAYHSGGTQGLGQPFLRLGQFSLCNNSLCRLADNAEDTADIARLVPNRRVGDIKIHVLRVAVALNIKRAILGEHRLAGLKNAPQQWLKIVPQLRPALPRRPAECAWMFATDRRRVGIVI